MKTEKKYLNICILNNTFLKVLRHRHFKSAENIILICILNQIETILS